MFEWRKVGKGSNESVARELVRLPSGSRRVAPEGEIIFFPIVICRIPNYGSTYYPLLVDVTQLWADIRERVVGLLNLSSRVRHPCTSLVN